LENVFRIFFSVYFTEVWTKKKFGTCFLKKKSLGGGVKKKQGGWDENFSTFFMRKI
jgi:hypothetical protein